MAGFAEVRGGNVSRSESKSFEGDTTAVGAPDGTPRAAVYESDGADIIAT